MPLIDEDTKVRIIADSNNNYSIRQTAARNNVNKSTVYKIIKKWREHHRISRIAGSGRRRISTAEQDQHFINLVRENPFSSAVDVANISNFPGSVFTARRRIRETNLRCHKPVKIFSLTATHKENRVGYALQHLAHNMDFWETVIFSDEKLFQSKKNGPIHVYRPRGQRFDENFIDHLNPQNFRVNFWGWISIHGTGILWEIEGNLNSNSYINILNDVFLPSADTIFPNRNFVFQQDNCPIHTANTVKTWFRQNNFNVLDFPSRSPDLNIIENVWGLMANRMKLLNQRPQNRNELIDFVQAAWESVNENNNYFFNLYNSIPNRLEQVINRNGSMTRY